MQLHCLLVWGLLVFLRPLVPKIVPLVHAGILAFCLVSIGCGVCRIACSFMRVQCKWYRGRGSPCNPDDQMVEEGTLASSDKLDGRACFARPRFRWQIPSKHQFWEALQQFRIVWVALPYFRTKKAHSSVPAFLHILRVHTALRWNEYEVCSAALVFYIVSWIFLCVIKYCMKMWFLLAPFTIVP